MANDILNKHNETVKAAQDYSRFIGPQKLKDKMRQKWEKLEKEFRSLCEPADMMLIDDLSQTTVTMELDGHVWCRMKEPHEMVQEGLDKLYGRVPSDHVTQPPEDVKRNVVPIFKQQDTADIKDSGGFDFGENLKAALGHQSENGKG